jgi:uncharacterized membrane protein YeaQ/YmgE (transglycosylase-associated protein family)
MQEHQSWIWWIIVGLIAGYLTGKIMRGRGFGFFVDIIVGIIGACLGGWLMGVFHLAPQGGMIYTIIVATIGAIILTWLLRLITGDRD